MKTRNWPRLLIALLAALFVMLLTACSHHQAPVAEKAATETTAAAEPIHTRGDPGEYEGKESSHVPVIVYKKSGSGLQVTVTVNHVMDPAIPHFIEWIHLMDGDGNILGEKSFVATDAKAEATFNLMSAPARLVAIERCNVHGLWKEEVPVT